MILPTVNIISFLENSFFLDNLSAVEQLALGSKFDNFIISNSTFSWWIAYLGKKNDSKIVRPLNNFRGKFAQQNDDIDYFPERWIKFDDRNISIEKKYWFFSLRGFIYELSLDIKFLFNRSKKNFKNSIR